MVLLYRSLMNTITSDEDFEPILRRERRRMPYTA